MIYAYQKHIDALRTVEIILPSDGSQRIGTELATIGDTTYVYVPDTATLPPQPAEITVAPATLTDALKADIKAASPHVRLISDRMQEKIREQYSLEDEAYFSRIGVGVALGAYAFQPGEHEALLAFGAFVESVRQWGRDQRALLGL